jgi:micrococcal nuclease
MFEYSATVLSIIDGDTLKLEVDLGFNIRVRERFRLARVNAPELMSIDGMKAKTFVTLQLSKAVAVKISSEKPRQEKYGRWLCELYFQTADSGDHWQSLNQLLLDTHHAVPMKH